MAERARDASAADLAAGIVEDAQRLARLEIQLAKQEAKELAIRDGIAVGLLAAGGVLALLGLVVALPVLIVELLPWHWIAAAVWLGLYLIGGAILALVGRAGLKIALPPRTLASLKETRAWVQRQISSSAR